MYWIVSPQTSWNLCGRVFSKTSVSVNNRGGFQKAEKQAENAPFLSAKVRLPFCGQPPYPGVYFGKNTFHDTLSQKGWVIPFPNGFFISNDGLYGRDRAEKRTPV